VNTESNELPPALAAKLAELKPLLVRQGVVLPRKENKCWRLRWHDSMRRNASLSLGTSEATAHKVKRLIAYWRQEWKAQQRDAAARRRDETFWTWKLPILLAKAARLHGCGWRRCTRLLRAYRAAATAGPLDLAAFAFGCAALLPRKGRDLSKTPTTTGHRST
jgi:hypothetical protein